MSAQDVHIRCTCDAVQGLLTGITAARGNHCVCYCDDCQSFAHFLDHAVEILDAHGGTRVFQVTPKRIRFSRGVEHIACMTLRPGGLLRWYAACCMTPIANTPAGTALPIVGVIHRCLGTTRGGEPADTVLGPVRKGVFGRYAKGDRNSINAHDRASLATIARVLRMIIGARVRGEIRHSPFLDPATQAPRVAPRVLTTDELRAVEQRRDVAFP